MRTRAVLRPVQPANESVPTDCAACGRGIVFSARNKPKVVIANVYEDGRWNRTEHFHEACYDGRHGQADRTPVPLRPGLAS